MCIIVAVFSGSRLAQCGEITMDAMIALADSGIDVHFTPHRTNTSASDTKRIVMRYTSDGLEQYALVLQPAGEAPQGGWPVVQFNHGFHPDPPKSGFVDSGQSDRPGDYYRGLVQAYAEQGFVVVAPDYRGHNVSEGQAFTQRVLADAWYTRDAIAAFMAIESLDGINPNQIYMAGHSMGGAITLRAAIALGERVKAASIWSTTGSQYLPRLMARELLASKGLDDSARAKQSLLALRAELDVLGEGVHLDQVTSTAYLGKLQVPLLIQHSSLDKSTPAAASLSLAAELYLAGKPYQFKLYPSEAHLFSGSDFTTAVAQDVAWFNRYR